MEDCSGVAVVVVADLHVEKGRWRIGTPDTRRYEDVGIPTGWTLLELGAALGLGLPVLVAHADDLDGASFDFTPSEPDVYRVRLGDDHDSASFRSAFDDWCGAVRERAARTG